MKIKEKARIMDEFLMKIGSSKMGSLPDILDDNPRTTPEKEEKYKIVESVLIRLELVEIMQKPGTNKTISGFGRYRISPKGLELITSKKSTLSLLKKEKEIISDRAWDVIKIVIGIILGLLLKTIYDIFIS